MKLTPFILLLALGLFTGEFVASAQTSVVPNLVSYQGRVTDRNGALIGTGTPVNRSVIFKLYTASSGGTPIWAETQTVTIAEGEFSVLIGLGDGVSGFVGSKSPAATPYKNFAAALNTAGTSSIYLGVTVDDGNSSTVDVEIAPRQQLVAGPFAIRAAVAETVASSAITSSMIGDLQVATNAIQSLAVTTPKIADAAITSAKIANGTVIAEDLASSSVTSDKIDVNTVGLWNVTGGNVYRGGNVGIGTNAPGFPLNFADVLGDKISLWGNSGNSFGFGIQPSLLQIHTSVSSSDIAFGYGSSAAMSETMRIKGNGNVGIGTTTPNFPMSFANTLGDKVALWGQDAQYHYGFGIQGGQLQIHTDSVGADIVFGHGGSWYFTERVRFKGNGRVGIGNNNPYAPLHVSGAQASGFYLQAYMDGSGAHDVGGNGQYRDDLWWSIISDGRIRAGAFDVNSDSRIKRDLRPSDREADLVTLGQIQITDYRLIDSVKQGNRPQKKVIAQQVEKVFPQAVGTSRGAVPDIYKSAVLKEGWVRLATTLKKGDRVQLVTKKEEAVYDVLEVAADKFRVEIEGDSEDVFVYGREVTDLRNVDYDAIAMLNVSATQALARRQEADRKENVVLKEKVVGLDKENTALREKIASFEARLQALEKLSKPSK